MKFFNALILLFSIAVSMELVAADVVISEIMYDPSQGSDTDLEWIELYNIGTVSVDLSDYTIDGSNFDDVIIGPKEYIVVAREFLDGSDEDLESFEFYYGNNDGTWSSLDGNYKAVDGSFSLTEEDTVILSSGSYSDSVNYSSSWGGKGNGKSIYKIDLISANTKENWAESIFDGGTPGKSKSNNGILVTLKVVESSTSISSIAFQDESTNPGYQILPVASESRQIPITVDVDSSMQLTAYADLNNNKLQLNEISQNSTMKTFNGNLQMQFYNQPGNYTINISVTDQNKKTIYKLLEFEYLPLIASSFDIGQIDFGSLQSGSTSGEKQVTIKNAGNVAIDLDASATDLSNGYDIIPASSLQIKHSSSYASMSTVPTHIDANINPGQDSSKQVYFKILIPQLASPNTYSGVISLNAIQG